MTDRLAELSAAGVAVWLDDISRERLATGGLDALRREKHVVGETSNPTIFAKALADSEDYVDQVNDLKLRKIGVDESARMITTYDVRWACDVLRPAYDASHGIDGRVSIEVDPRLAHETDRTIAEAKQLWWLVDRENLFIKIPATAAGIPAIAATLAQGISVNVTLIFGLERYEAVMDAFLSGMEQAKANGHELSRMASVASFFVSRVDTEVDKRLDKIGSPEAQALHGKAAIANARLAYERYEKVFTTDRWKALADASHSAANEAARWAGAEVQPALDQGKETVKDLASQASEAGGQAVDRAGELLQNVAPQAKEVASNLYERGSQSGEYARQFAAEQPVAALLIAAAIGYGLAYLIHRR